MKKKVLLFILSAIIGISPVMADTSSNIVGGGGQAGNADAERQCQNGYGYSPYYRSDTGYIQAVRLTVVDESGNRVSSSADFTSTTDLFTGGVPNNLDYGTIKF